MTKGPISKIPLSMNIYMKRHRRAFLMSMVCLGPRWLEPRSPDNSCHNLCCTVEFVIDNYVYIPSLFTIPGLQLLNLGSQSNFLTKKTLKTNTDNF